MPARIYRPARNAMQSGAARSKGWVLEYDNETGRETDPLMGWTSSADTQAQVRLRFSTKEEALDYAKDRGIEAEICEVQTRAPVLRQGGYGENFANNRRETWTH